jgi:N-dimethylarginine dimethylaminohydrolase
VSTSASLSETGALKRVVLKHARDAFVSQVRLSADWRELNFLQEPDFVDAVAEYEAFARVIADTGADIHWAPPSDRVTIDSIYVRDAAVLVPGGVVLAAMGKPQRGSEPGEQRETLEAAGLPILGRIRSPGMLEGGDVVWIDDVTVAVGRGYRTNDAGIDQFRRLLGPAVTCLSVPLPHWRGVNDVFHLMSMISPVDHDLAVVYAPLLPVPFREFLLDRGYTLVEVPEVEFDSMGANVLALGPRRCLMVDGNPETRRRLESAGADVTVYAGREISVKGGGGPTCLTRPVERGS